MADLLGPASAPNSTTAKPTDSRTFGSDDTWLKDCTSPLALDGTAIQAAFLNGMLEQIREAIDGMGITRNNADPEMLLKAIQAAGAGFVPLASVPLIPIYPNQTGTPSVTPTTGQIVVNTGWGMIFRGMIAIQASAYLLAARTFATSANKTYHLRWDRTLGFQLRDLADVTYNPTALAESNGAFDTIGDNALIARVVTNGSNVPTVTLLANKAGSMKVYAGVALTGITNSGANLAQGSWTTPALNLSRTPIVLQVTPSQYNKNTGTGDHDYALSVINANRYIINGTMMIDGMTSGTVTITAETAD